MGFNEFCLVVVVGLGIYLVYLYWQTQSNGGKIDRIKCEVVGKRMSLNNDFTQYYFSFKNAAGVILELPVPGKDYGILEKGDAGVLLMVGSQYAGFERKV